MKTRNLYNSAILIFAWLFAPNLSYATQVITLQINPSTSWVQDIPWVEILPNSTGEIPNLSSGIPFGEPKPEAIYHPSERFSLSGNINVILGRNYLYSLETEAINVSPGILPSGRNVTLDLPAQTLRDGVFPNELAFSLPAGTICACFRLDNPFAPKISGAFDGKSLSVDFTSNEMQFFGFYPNVTWIGGSPSYSMTAENKYSFHIEASVVPLPPTAVLFLSALGFMSLSRKLR
ncbi:hypothetical protein [Methylomonas sp. CM2]|uniref:hypothetical protein n=1 Tax=Methylomonas sp. CM2 TaxID=3417647 RepID=UPI003CE6B573